MLVLADLVESRQVYAWAFMGACVIAALLVLRVARRPVPAPPAASSDAPPAAVTTSAPAAATAAPAAVATAAPRTEALSAYAAPAAQDRRHPGRAELFREALVLGLIGFGGGLAVLAQIEHRVVMRRRWVPPLSFLEIAAIAQSIPGAVATNALALVGLRLAGPTGAFAATAGFVLPSFLMMLLAAQVYPLVRGMVPVLGAFRGLNPAVAGLVVATGLRFAERLRRTPEGRPEGWRGLLRDRWSLGVVLISVVAVAFGGVGVVEVIVISGLIGVLRLIYAGVSAPLEGRWRWLRRRVWRAARAGAEAITPPWWRRWRGPEDDDLLGFTPWIMALAIPASLLGRAVAVLTVAGVFLRAGALTFGGGFVMIPLLETELVKTRGWLPSEAFTDAVTLGQITPGPVVITATFVGYFVAGLAGSVLATAAVFLPAFLLVLAIGSSIERFRKSTVLQAFLDGLQPAVVGLLIAAGIALWRHGVSGGLEAGIAIVALLLVWRGGISPARVLALACVVGLVATLMGY